ncbi:hypothetical protein D3C81_2215430 [compost metagenome]
MQVPGFRSNHRCAELSGKPQVLLETVDFCPADHRVWMNGVDVAAENTDTDPCLVELLADIIGQAGTQFAGGSVDILYCLG